MAAHGFTYYSVVGPAATPEVRATKENTLPDSEEVMSKPRAWSGGAGLIGSQPL